MAESANGAKRCLVTGGAGFIGSALVRLLLRETSATVLVLDRLTYAGDPANLAEAGLRPDLTSSNPRLTFLKADICDCAAVAQAFETFRPDTVFHLAAESHVDRSIAGPAAFVQTNVAGTAVLLEVARSWWNRHPDFLFQHVSTDEVYGALGPTGCFTEHTPYAPHSPYSATKAASDHLVRAWHDTYGLPVVITNCSNNYGPYQHPEKLIPRMIREALAGRPLPVYGNGANVRDWLHVEDHARALLTVNERGRIGETYVIGGRCERTNREVVAMLCALLDEMHPRAGGGSHAELVTSVTDRAGHDFRYAIDPTKIETELGWRPQRTFETGLRETVAWYLSQEPVP